MKLISSNSKAISVRNLCCSTLIFVGNLLTATGCLGILLGVLGIFEMDFFSFGLSSGIRIIGTVAIAGCMLSAVGYGILDYTDK